MKDIAALAGVSHGTVSNVLNKKGNVSVEKINLVENAARTLGFKLNAQAQQLRQGKTKRVALIVPKINLKRYTDLFLGMSNILNEKGYAIDIHYTNDLSHAEAELITQVESTNPAAIVVVSSFLKNEYTFRKESNIIFVERYIEGMPENAKYMTFDYKMAGSEIATRCLKEGHKDIAILCGRKQFSNNRDFIKGITDVLDVEDCNYKVYSADSLVGFNTAFEIMTKQTNFKAIITTDIENIEYIKRIHQYNPLRPLPQLYALTSTDIVPTSCFVKYELNYKLCGKIIGEYIDDLYEEKSTGKDRLILKNDGFCDSIELKRDIEIHESLNLLMLSSPTSEALRKLLPSFTLRTGIDVKMVEVGYDELYKSVTSPMGGKMYDLMRLDVLWLSELGENLFQPLDMEGDWLKGIKAGFSPNLPEDYYKVGKDTYALPFDPSVQLMYYRKDLFEDALIKRKFYETYKRQLDVPKTFSEYNEVANFFTKKFNKDSPTEYGTALVFGRAAVAAADYLPRWKELGGEITDRQGNISIEDATITKALNNYLETYRYTDQKVNSWWENATEGFSKGNIAMTITFSNHAAPMVQSSESDVVGKIGFATVPGGYPLLGGGVIGISKHSKKQEACQQFLEWIYSEKTATMITFLGGYINHKNLSNNLDILEIYPWIQGIEDSFSYGWRRDIALKYDLFNQSLFEEVLGEMVRSIISGVMEMDEGIGFAKEYWKKMKLH